MRSHNTHTTHWQLPANATRKKLFTQGGGPLPPGWSIHHTNTGRPFYANKVLKKTTWIDPRIKQIVTEGKDEQLPDGWELAVDGDGHVCLCC